MSRVVVIKYTGNPDNTFLEREQYRTIFEAGLELLSDGAGHARLLKRLFPKGAVGMKTNCLARWNPTSLPMVDALTELLVANAGKDENDIIVWERSNRELKNAGFQLNASSFGRRCLVLTTCPARINSVIRGRTDSTDSPKYVAISSAVLGPFCCNPRQHRARNRSASLSILRAAR